MPDFIPASSTGEISVETEEKVKHGFKFSGCDMLKNSGSLIAIRFYGIKSKHVNHHMCSTVNCASIPLLHTEDMLFPSMHWKSAKYNVSLLGVIPSSFMNENVEEEGFFSVQDHLNSRLLNASSATSTNPRCEIHCCDTMANLATSKSDTRLIINIGIGVENDSNGNLEVRGSESD